MKISFMNKEKQETIRLIFEQKKAFHKSQTEEPVEKKFETLLKLQELHLSFKKLRGEKLKYYEKVWEKQ